MWQSDQGSLNRERRRIDTRKPRRATHVNCSHHYPDVWITPAKTRVKGPSRRTPWEPGGDIHSNTRHHSTPRVAGRSSSYRCKSGLQLTGFDYLLLPAWGQYCSILDQCANNGTVLNRHRRRSTFHTFHIHHPIPLRPVSIFLFSQIHSQTTLA